MINHTPEPWITTGKSVHTQGLRLMIADCENPGLPEDEVKINLRMIHRAPRLLKLLMELADDPQFQRDHAEQYRKINEIVEEIKGEQDGSLYGDQC